MAIYDSDGDRGPSPQRLPGARLAGVIGTLLSIVVGILALYWFVFRIEVREGEVLVLVNKTGRRLPAELATDYGDQVVLYPDLVAALAEHSGMTPEKVLDSYKGIRYDPLPTTRYFFNPYSYKRVRMPMTEIGQDEVGVLIRRYGKPLPSPKTVATAADERGPVAQFIEQGYWPVNLLAYEVQKFPVMQIPEGHAGVVTLLSGSDPETHNTYTVAPGEKGVQRTTLPPGRVPYNPYLRKIEIVDIRSHKYDMLDEDAIRFPSNDGFTITLEGTIEWAIMPDQVAEVTVAYGDEQDILNKVILPNARSISRIQGSKLKAREFISGKLRQQFQERLLAELRGECRQQGINIKAALVREIQPPSEIAGLISHREQADQEIERSTNQMEEAKAEVMLVEQRELQSRNRDLGNARRDVVGLIKKAEQRQTVAVTQANRELEVSRLHLEAAEKEAAALRSRGQAEANVVLFEYQARAEPLESAVAAFGGGEAYAQLFFLEKIAPSIQTILTNTDGNFAEIFKQFQSFPASTPTGGE